MCTPYCYSVPSFGFETIMARPDYARFRDWYARTSLLAPPRRAEVEATFARIEDEAA
jgi:hypothetical protein